jgi:hypothetical protein
MNVMPSQKVSPKISGMGTMTTLSFILKIMESGLNMFKNRDKRYVFINQSLKNYNKSCKHLKIVFFPGIMEKIIQNELCIKMGKIWAK